MNKEILNEKIVDLNFINYKEMCLNHMVYALENATGYKELLFMFLGYSHKIVMINEIEGLGLQKILTKIIKNFR